MPAARGQTRLIRRLTCLLEALSPLWVSEAALIAAASYPESDESARRMLRADLQSLIALGFQIERSAEHSPPAYRLAGHARWPTTYQPE